VRGGEAVIKIVVNAVLPDDGQELDIERRIANMWPGSMTNLSNMGARDGTLTVTEDWRLLFEFPNGVQLLWHENTRQWETIWGTVP
jgi:hypothetical protein